MSECKYSVGQRVMAVGGVTPECAEHQNGYYGHVVKAYPASELHTTPIYDVQLVGRRPEAGECLWFMVTPNDPHPFFEMELEAAD